MNNFDDDKFNELLDAFRYLLTTKFNIVYPMKIDVNAKKEKSEYIKPDFYRVFDFKLMGKHYQIITLEQLVSCCSYILKLPENKSIFLCEYDSKEQATKAHSEIVKDIKNGEADYIYGYIEPKYKQKRHKKNINKDFNKKIWQERDKIVCLIQKNNK